MPRKPTASPRPTPSKDVRKRPPETTPDKTAERLRIAEEVLQFGTWDWDLVSGDLAWTPELEAIYGLQPGAFGRSYADFAKRVHPEDLGHLERCRDETVAACRSFDLEFRIIRPDGEVRWVRSKGNAIRDDGGKALRVIGINIDITRQKNIQQALLTNEARLQAALKLTHLLIFHQDRQLRYTWIANPALGATAADLIGRSDDEVLGKQAARPLTTIKRRVLRTGLGERQEVWVALDKKNGCFDLIVEPERGPDGRITGVICAAADITERKLAEDHLRLQAAILENMEEGVNLVDAQGILRYTNPKFDAMFGYADGELVGQPAATLNAPNGASPEETARSIIRTLQRKGGWTGELRNRRKDGREFWTHANIVSAHHPDFGEIWVSVQSDITELRQAQDERDAAYRAIGHLADHLQDDTEEQRRALAREVHDQIGTTLTGIRMRLEAMLDGPCRNKLLDIRDLIDRALATTRNLCTELRPPMLDDLGLAETLRWYVDDWSRQASIRSSVRISALGQEPADPLRIDLFRMLQELLTNVARHAGAQRVSVSLSRARGALQLRVSDDGRGFSPGDASGFGLLGIRERLRRHGGTMHIDSVGRGSKVTLRIPD
jgi:hypothetical protein